MFSKTASVMLLVVMVAGGVLYVLSRMRGIEQELTKLRLLTQTHVDAVDVYEISQKALQDFQLEPDPTPEPEPQSESSSDEPIIVSNAVDVTSDENTMIVGTN